MKACDQPKRYIATCNMYMHGIFSRYFVKHEDNKSRSVDKNVASNGNEGCLGYLIFHSCGTFFDNLKDEFEAGNQGNKRQKITKQMN